MTKKTKSNLRLGIIVNILIFILGTAFLLFNDNGIFKFMNLRERLNDMDSQVSQADNQLNLLDSEIDSLKTKMVKIEKTAREKYYMKKKNEIVLEIEEYTN